MGARGPSAEEARRRAQEILARDEFQPPEENVLQRALDWLDESIRSLLNTLLSGGAGSLFAWLVLGVLVAIVVVVALRVTRTVRAVPARAVVADRSPTRSPADWRAEAERHEREGDWKEGLRCRYRALVAELVARDVVRDVPGRTAGEYRMEVREHAPHIAVPFAGASELFERAWYGDFPTGPDESARFRVLADDVLSGAHR